MSHVSDIILITAIEDGAAVESDHPNADRLSEYLRENHKSSLIQVDGHAGGNKAVQADVFMAAINYLDIPAFVAAFKSVHWEIPECAQLLIKDEHDDRFTEYRIET
jgi:hypothetical protein